MTNASIACLKWLMRSLLAVAIAVLPSACTMGDITNGPLPVNVTAEQLVGTWEGHDNAGTSVFATDGTLMANDLPADALPPLDPTQRWSCAGTWQIERNLVELGLRDLAGVTGGYAGRLSASKPDAVIVLAVGNYWYTKTQ